MNRYKFSGIIRKEVSPFLEIILYLLLILFCVLSLLPAPGLTILIVVTLITFLYGGLNLFNLKEIYFGSNEIYINDIKFRSDDIKCYSIRRRYLKGSKSYSQTHLSLTCKKDSFNYYFRGILETDTLNDSEISQLEDQLEGKFKEYYLKEGEGLDPSFFRESMNTSKFVSYAILNAIFLSVGIWALVDYMEWERFEFSFNNQAYYAIPLIIYGLTFVIFRSFLLKMSSPIEKISNGLHKYVEVRKTLAAIACTAIIFLASERLLFSFNRLGTTPPHKYRLELIDTSMAFVKGGCFNTLLFKIPDEDQTISLLRTCKETKLIEKSGNFRITLKKGKLGGLILSGPLEYDNKEAIE